MLHECAKPFVCGKRPLVGELRCVRDFRFFPLGGFHSGGGPPLAQRLAKEQADCLRNGIHLIVAQSADGSLVVGDSHHYAATPDPFAPGDVEGLILTEFEAATGLAPPPVLARWTGTYASAEAAMFVDAPAPNVRLAMVTSGTGASTSFAIAEEVIGELFNTPLGDTGL